MNGFDKRCQLADAAVAEMEQQKTMSSRDIDRVLTPHRRMGFLQTKLSQWVGMPGGSAYHRIRSEASALAWAILIILDGEDTQAEEEDVGS